MDEIDSNKGNNSWVREESKRPLMEEIRELKQFKNEMLQKGVTRKKIKIPRKAKVTKRKLKKGWIGILRVDENRNITGEKQRLSGSAYMTKDGHYHASDGREILFFEGKFPVVIQPSWRNNPLPLDPKNEKNETYGDKYKMAKMLADTIKVKAKGGNIIIWILVAAAALFGINYIAGGGLFG